jgi:hypothetical protein
MTSRPPVGCDDGHTPERFFLPGFGPDTAAAGNALCSRAAMRARGQASVTPRLRAGIWVRALIRRAETAGAAAYVARKGDETAGVVLVKVSTLDGLARVLSPSTGLDGGRLWLRATGAAPVVEAEAEAYIARQLKYDPDLWVIEIEDRDGRDFLGEPIE